MSASLEVENLSFRYAGDGKAQQYLPWTLDGVSLTVPAASTLGIVGESGSGKSTLIRLMCGLIGLQRGQVRLNGRALGDWLKTDGSAYRRATQIVFQNPRRSFDPRMTIGESLSQPIRALEHRRPSSTELTRQLEHVGLSGAMMDRYPHQVSGGQLQRVAIARALTVKPKVLYADEATSALDVSVQAQVLNLLMDLRDELGLTLILVTHNLAVVGRLAEHLVVLRHGKLVEEGPTPKLLSTPSDAYTAALVSAANAVSLTAEQRF